MSILYLQLRGTAFAVFVLSDAKIKYGYPDVYTQYSTKYMREILT